jgi:hypothetical protein
VGEYTYRCSTMSELPSMAVHAALLEAEAQGIMVEGMPVVTRRRVPIPLLGPKTEFVVRFERASRVRKPLV